MMLSLPLTPSVQEQLLADEAGNYLQVWTSGRRIDAAAPPMAGFKSTVMATSGKVGTTQALGFVNDTVYRVTPTPTTSTNPAARGSYRTKRVSYDIKPGFNYSQFPALLEVLGEVTYPEASLPSGSKFPLVMFLHGRHPTCYSSSDWFGEWPCPEGTRPIPSHSGYRYVTDVLASQGYVAVSISANGINGQDWDASDGGALARSRLVRHHLSLWAMWNKDGGDPWGGSTFKNKVDINRVVLVGHSRGGEGVNRAAIEASASDPYTIVGLVSYGPTAFGFQVTPDVHSATILPTCDGDVYDLQGQAYVDYSRDIASSPALRSAVIAVGANHNYFNTEWTPGLAVAPAWDDWWNSEDAVCGSTSGIVRLTPAEQQKVGAAYTLALVRLAVKQETAMLPLLDGSFVRPAAIGRAEVGINAVGGAAYSLLYRPESSGRPSLAKGMEGGECRGNTWTSEPSSLPLCGDGEVSGPHWLGSAYHPARQAMELRWNTTESGGATAIFPVSTSKRDLSAYDHINVRVANDPRLAKGAQLRLMVRDSRGRSAALNTSLASIEGWPGSDTLDRVHARAFRGSLASVPVSRVGLKNITAVLLVAKTQFGRVWVLDVAATKRKVQVPPALNLPALSVENVVIPEGNGPRSASVRILADRPVASPATVWLERRTACSGSSRGYALSLSPGSSKVVASLPFSWVGDKLYSPSHCLSEQVTVGAISGVVTSSFSGGVTVEEDEVPPILSVVNTVVQAPEGSSLEWKMVLSGPTGGFDLSCYAIPAPPGRTELKSNDVPSSWLQKTSWAGSPSTPTPLSELSVYVSVRFDYGSTKASLLVPIARDGAAEGDEWVSFQCFDVDTVVGGSVLLFGKVPKHR
jgi:hypothetical protein